MVRHIASTFTLVTLGFLTLSSCGSFNQPKIQDNSSENSVTAEITTDTLVAQSGSKLSDTTARARVKAAGIAVYSSGNCSDRKKKTCTSLEQVYSGTISNIIILKQASKCSITITGGTEVGHPTSKDEGKYNHTNGYKLDISQNSCINSYIKRNFAGLGRRTWDGAMLYKSNSGNFYADKGTNWDITYF